MSCKLGINRTSTNLSGTMLRCRFLGVLTRLQQCHYKTSRTSASLRRTEITFICQVFTMFTFSYHSQQLSNSCQINFTLYLAIHIFPLRHTTSEHYRSPSDRSISEPTGLLCFGDEAYCWGKDILLLFVLHLVHKSYNLRVPTHMILYLLLSLSKGP